MMFKWLCLLSFLAVVVPVQARTPGAQAVHNGSTFEDMIVTAATAQGYRHLSYQDWQESEENGGDRLLLEHVPYKTLYGTKGRFDYLLVNRSEGSEIPLIIKWQQSRGSVEEKLPYTYLSALGLPHEKIIMIVDGPGFTDRALSWLRKAAIEGHYQDNHAPKEILVMTVEEWLTWANRSLN